MRVVFVDLHDPAAIRTWSGTPHHMGRALEQQGIEVVRSQALVTRERLHHRLKAALCRRLHAGRYVVRYENDVLQSYGDQVLKLAEASGASAVLSTGSLPVSRLPGDLPVLFWADATFACAQRMAPAQPPLARTSVSAGHRYERAALRRASAALYASEWAAQSAVSDYAAEPSRVHVVPFGANLESEPDPELVASAVRNRSSQEVNLLFLAARWHDKGGDIAAETARLLNHAHVPATLHVVGCHPPGRYCDEQFVRCHGFLRKDIPKQVIELIRILSSSHFLILPTRHECYGIVFCEASSRGVPSLATRVGGTPTAVRDGCSGKLFELGDGPVAYADYVAEIMRSPQRYLDLALSSFQEYRTRLNWRTATGRVVALLDGLLSG